MIKVWIFYVVGVFFYTNFAFSSPIAEMPFSRTIDIASERAVVQRNLHVHVDTTVLSDWEYLIQVSPVYGFLFSGVGLQAGMNVKNTGTYDDWHHRICNYQDLDFSLKLSYTYAFLTLGIYYKYSLWGASITGDDTGRTYMRPYASYIFFGKRVPVFDQVFDQFPVLLLDIGKRRSVTLQFPYILLLLCVFHPEYNFEKQFVPSTIRCFIPSIIYNMDNPNISFGIIYIPSGIVRYAGQAIWGLLKPGTVGIKFRFSF